MFKVNNIVRVNFQTLIKMIIEKILDDFDFQTISKSSLHDEWYES